MASELNPKQLRFVCEYLIDLNATQAAIRAGYILEPCQNIPEFYVYLLTDSRNGEIFYVGKGFGQRFAAHLNLNRSDSNGRKRERIASIIAGGGRVEPLCFGRFPESEAIAIERELIRAIGLQRLTNAIRGQMTESQRDAWLAKADLARIKPLGEWMAERPRSLSDIWYYRRITEELGKIAQGLFCREVVFEWSAAA